MFWIPFEEELSPPKDESPRDSEYTNVEPLSKPLNVYLVEDNAVNQLVIKYVPLVRAKLPKAIVLIRILIYVLL